MKSNKLYIETLLNLLEKDDYVIEHNDLFLVNLYTMLLSLNNNNYSLLNVLEEEKLVKILLIKLNNLKVKIQLKRKEKEINNLINEIKELFSKNEKILCRYISNKEELFSTIDSLDPKLITNYIDKVTKIEMSNSRMIEENNTIREDVLSLILNNKYDVSDNMIIISQKNNNNYIISVDEFLDIFSYLLNDNNYIDIYKRENSNNSHKGIINKIISLINEEEYSKEKLGKLYIPLILTYILPNIRYNDIRTNDFVIENIKISDLYSIANKNINDEMTAKWNNVSIPNEYLFKKICEMVNRGMYYFNDDKFILEYVDNKISDFKLSIDIEKMKLFLIENLELYNQLEKC